MPDPFNKKIKHVFDSIDKMDLAMIKHQKYFYDLLVKKYINKFDTLDGNITFSDKNINLLGELDKFLDDISGRIQKTTMSKYGVDMIDMLDLTKDYFVTVGIKKKALDNYFDTKIKVNEILGINKNGKLKKSGYLYKVAEMPEVRQILKDYVVNSTMSNASLSSFQLGFKDLINKNETDGVLQRYHRQYTYDLFNQVDSVSSVQIANNFGLEHFIYQGGLIPTSRKFCKKRDGKVFTIKETETWKNDKDLIDKKTKESYNPLIERGRYNCRHFLKFISKQLYEIKKK